ncbi:hypothetical protein [Catellatospora sp. IY07-71]|uniref:hypothetical protein n=1 Tax=Catellatospora sp. IY07-71 TaxID=2728827 RepID=UPI001BB45FBB|nr:hypothetical protein [Catellatospora sp. IY07-71]
MSPLDVAPDDAWLSLLGVAPQTEEISGDEYVRELRFPITDTDELHLTWDQTDQSVRIRLNSGTAVVVDLFREQATLLTAEVNGTQRFIVLKYRAEGCTGTTRVQVQPAFAITDTFLRT